VYVVSCVYEKESIFSIFFFQELEEIKRDSDVARKASDELSLSLRFIYHIV
jgi:hypothetical protein